MLKFYSTATLICITSLLFGCQAATDSQTSTRPAGATPDGSGGIQSAAADLTLVKLKVPNMT